MRGLPKSINCLLKPTNVRGKMRMSEVVRLSHEHCFMQGAVKKGVLDIILADGPLVGDSKG